MSRPQESSSEENEADYTSRHSTAILFPNRNSGELHYQLEKSQIDFISRERKEYM